MTRQLQTSVGLEFDLRKLADSERFGRGLLRHCPQLLGRNTPPHLRHNPAITGRIT